MPDLKLRDLVKSSDLGHILASEIRTKELRKVAEAFTTNVRRIDGTASLPSVTAMLATGSQRAIDLATLRLTNNLDPVAMDHPQFQAIVDAAVTTWKTELVSLYQSADQQADALKATSDRIQSFSEDEKWGNTLQHWLATIPLSTWTAFETMAGDLWATAINVHPQGLSNLGGAPTRIRNKSSGTRTGNQSAQKIGKKTPSIRLGDVERFTNGKYEIAGRIGDLLRRKFKFSTLAGIRSAYSQAFASIDKKPAPDAIDAALADKSLDQLSAVRNLIVHKSGCADHAYEEQSKKCGAPRLEAGQSLVLDGELVRDLIDPVIDRGCDLILAVDRWITPRGANS